MSNEKTPKTRITEASKGSAKTPYEGNQRGRSFTSNTKDVRTENIAPDIKERPKLDKETWQKNVDEGKELQSKKAASDMKQPDSRINGGKNTAKQVFDKVEGLGQGLKKVVPYLGDFAKGVGTKAVGVVGAFLPESTATDEEMRLHELDSQKASQETLEPLRTEPPLFSSNEERDKVFETMSSIEIEKPNFLKDLEPDIELEFDHLDIGEPSLDGSDGGDGGDGGGE